MLLVLSRLVYMQQQNDIEEFMKILSETIDQSVMDLRQKFNIESISNYFIPISNYNMQPGALLPYNKAKWNKLMNITQSSHQNLLKYLDVHKYPCHVRRPINVQELDIFNGRIVDLNNIDMKEEDESCVENTFLEEMKNVIFNNIFPEEINSSRVSNRYSSVFLAEIQTGKQYRYPASGSSLEDIICIRDQFLQKQQIIIGFGSESTDLLKSKQKVLTQNINYSKTYSNSYSFEDRCIDRSVRVFVKGIQHVFVSVPQIISAKDIQSYLQNIQLTDPTIDQIISALEIINKEFSSNYEKSHILNNISNNTNSSLFKSTEVLILVSSLDTFQIRRVQNILKKHKFLLISLQNINININFKTLNPNSNSNDEYKIKVLFNKAIQIHNIQELSSNFKLFSAKKDEFGQISFILCSNTDKYLICSKIPQKGFLIQPQAQILFENFGQVLIMNKDNFIIQVDSFNQNVGQQFGQHVGSQINQTIINIIQTNTSTMCHLFNKIVISTQLDHDLIYMIYLEIPNSYTSVLPNTQVYGDIEFNASILCYNLSYYDQQCTNKLNIYFPQNYIGSNILSPQQSIYMKGVTMTVQISQKFALFLETEFDFTQTNQSTYFNIFNESITDTSRFLIALSQKRNYDALKNTYDYVKQYFDDAILYVGRTTVSGPMAIYPDNKMTEKTFKIIHNISIKTIIDNVMLNTNLVLKEFDCEFFTDSGINQDQCLFVGLPFTNFLLAQDFFVVRKSSAFQLFLRHNKQIVVDLDLYHYKFQINSLSQDSFSYKCSQYDYQIINWIFFNSGFGNCIYVEQAKTFNINQILFELKHNIIKTNYVIVPLISSKSIILGFKSDITQDFEYSIVIICLYNQLSEIEILMQQKNGCKRKRLRYNQVGLNTTKLQ
ncbi:Conserved_hypothetical protein [Hexamita inflata]|uniref:Uncharacterized protein n=1 Tax=Hexamita inflata TaxID=28002 RepID=A0AA86PN30_9EUKA|nr:Conserved hypothetical protein [Hexamita inflata]